MSDVSKPLPNVEELDLFIKQLYEWRGISNQRDAELNLQAIPRFYEKTASEKAAPLYGTGAGAVAVADDLRQKVSEEARSLFLQKKSRELLDNGELKQIWDLLDKHHTPPVLEDEKMINYRSFKAVGEAVPAKAKQFFTTLVFAKFQQKDPYGRVSISLLFNYIMRKTWLRQSRIGLSLYDLTGRGYLTEKDLDLYVTELIPTLSHLKKLDESFQSFYVCTATRRFLFFLDPKRLGKVRIVDILASGFLDDLLELRDIESTLSSCTPTANQNSSTNSPHPFVDPSLSTATYLKLERNWFSVANALRVYGQYLNLDTDRNGMLSKAELKQYGSGTLTDVFIERLFQECLTYDGEMDYKAFLDFCLAMEHKNDPASLQYFFRILDVRQQGYIDAFAINYFFRAIQKLLEQQDQPMVSFEDIKDELFDMIKPKDAVRIRLQDLIDCGQGDTVVSILTDLNGFWTYENREYLATEQKDESDC